MAQQPPPSGPPGQQPLPLPLQPTQQPQLSREQNLQQNQQSQTWQLQRAQRALQPVASSSSSSVAADAPSEESKSKKPRPRRSSPKVKTGCNTCKKRHIKCDEKRPVCTHCFRANVICSGYPPPNIRNTGSLREVPIAPRTQILQPAPIAPTPVVYGPIAWQPIPATSRMQQRQLPFTPPVTPVPTILYTPPHVLPFTQLEGMYFELFRLQTTSELSGFFDDKFWSRSVLIECQTSAAIRHAVVALGALYKTLETTTASPPGSPSDTITSSDVTKNVASHWEVALSHYSSACGALNPMNPDSECTQRTRIMASVLLACFDSFIGDHKQAISQIQIGMLLLQHMRASYASSNPRESTVSDHVEQQPQQLWQIIIQRQPNTLPIEEELLQMFTRLAIQAKSYDLAFHFPQPYVIQFLPPTTVPAPDLSSSASSSPSDGPLSPEASSDNGSAGGIIEVPLPERFASLRDARLAWDAICESFFCFTESMAPYATAPPNLLPKFMRGYGKHLMQHVESWSNAFEPLMAARTLPGVSSQEKAAIAVLKMSQIMGQIVYLMTFNHSEMEFDGFQPQFQEIITLAWEVVSDEEQRAAMARCPDRSHCAHDHRDPKLPDYYRQPCSTNHIKASFSANLGIVPPLYVVATKSRDRILRRQAIQLLRSSARREGMWDSELMACVGTWVMLIEEGAVDNDSVTADPVGPIPRPKPSQWTPIPPEKRVLIRSCEFDLREHKAVLWCGTRENMPGQVDEKAQSTVIQW